MSQLEHQIATWRDSMRRTGTVTEDDICELERHVRDSVDDLMRVGLATEEAILVALRRLGDPSVLAVEYHKVNPGLAWARRWYWMAAGFLGFTVALEAARFASLVGAWLTRGTSSPGTWFIGVSLAALAAVCLGILRSARKPGGLLARTLQSVLGWAERHPVATAHVGFTVLAGLTILNGLVGGVVWPAIGVDGLYAIATFKALAATAAPVGLFLLGGHLTRDDRRLTDPEAG